MAETERKLLYAIYVSLVLNLASLFFIIALPVTGVITNSQDIVRMVGLVWASFSIGVTGRAIWLIKKQAPFDKTRFTLYIPKFIFWVSGVISLFQAVWIQHLVQVQHLARFAGAQYLMWLGWLLCEVAIIGTGVYIHTRLK